MAKADADLAQLGGTQSANRIVLTVGKVSVVDIFDVNKYAHDPRNDFLNWAIIDVGSFDYAADAWGTTYGAAVEWYQDWWAARVGLFDLSSVPNSIALRLHGQFWEVMEMTAAASPVPPVRSNLVAAKSQITEIPS
jgi:high affinity Mn2+ porin